LIGVAVAAARLPGLPGLDSAEGFRQLRASVSRELALLLDLGELIANLILNIANARARGRAVIASLLVGVMNSILDVAEQRHRQTWVDGLMVGQLP
jgi:hypothetical protein